MTRELRYGNMPVPYSVSWSAEESQHLAKCPHAEGRIAACNAVAPGEGKPQFGKPHMQRHREVIADGLCDLCGKTLHQRTKVSLSHARPQPGAEGLCVMQVEPLLHKECAATSLRYCPSLKRDIERGTLRVRQVLRYRVQFAMMTSAATLEFTGVCHPGAIGHAKVELLAWKDRNAAWLGG
ncbi:hypothetical protein LJR231_001545 [Phyllobacterium sp. LjRoot231]|uniref:hypothetical protein n=1 Tax=Phyllobacterium sp. LjRoot231 TaxID=3342289 RepID=UPI003ECDF65E